MRGDHCPVGLDGQPIDYHIPGVFQVDIGPAAAFQDELPRIQPLGGSCGAQQGEPPPKGMRKPCSPSLGKQRRPLGQKRGRVSQQSAAAVILPSAEAEILPVQGSNWFVMVVIPFVDTAG